MPKLFAAFARQDDHERARRSTRHRRTERSRRHRDRGRLLPAFAAGTALAIVFGGVPMMATAAPGDDSQSLGSFLNADLLPVDVVDVASAYASFPGGPATDADPFNLQVLETVEADLDLVGGGLLRLPLLTDGTGPGLLELGELGAITGYASSTSPLSAVAASGAVTDDGTIAVSTTADPGDYGDATLDLTDLLGQLGVAAVTDALIDEASLEIGALASRAVDAPGSDPESDYRVTDLGIELHSPAVAAIAQSLRDSLTVATTELTDDLEALAGPDGAVTGVVDAISDVDLLGVASVSLGDAEISVTPPNLTGLVDDVLGGPGAVVVSDDGSVTIDLTDGSVSVDLANLVNPDGPNLNGLPANTPVLTTDTIQLISAGITNALGKVAGNVTSGLTTALQSTGLTIALDVDVTALPALGGIALVDAPVLVSGSLAQFAAGTATVDTSQLTLLPGVPLCLGATVAGECLGVDVNTLLGSVLDLVTDTLVPTVLAGALTPLTGVLTATGAEITDALDDVIGDVLGPLSPAVDGLLANIVDVVINDQPDEGDLGPGSFTVRALSVTLLPNLAASNLVSLDLASSTVTALADLPGAMITSLDPSTGPTTGGTGVTITGDGLDDATSVTVDDVSVPFTVASDTSLSFETPTHAAGAVDVVVTSPAGASNALPFTYVPAPVLLTIAPDEGPTAGGTAVTVTGTDLAGTTGVTVDGDSVAFTQVSGTEIAFTTPAHAAGGVDVVVTTAGGASAPLTFTYVASPVLTGLDPAAGPVAGGTTVTIGGTDLGGATQVTVGGQPVPFTPVSGTEIEIQTPAGTPGTVDVVVTTPGGESNPLPFEYVAAPVLTELAPDEGPASGGTLVTVTGTALSGATEVSVDGQAVAFTQVGPTRVTFVTPPHAAGVVAVSVTTAGGESGPLAYTYLPAPVILDLDPDQGPEAGGTEVTVTGELLADATEVTVDGTTVPFAQIDDATIVFTTPAHTPGEADVVVTTPVGATNAFAFTYLPSGVLPGDGGGDGAGPGAGAGPDTGPGSGAGASGLTSTGFDVLLPMVGGLILLIVGIGILLVARRRSLK